ncbi:MAG: CAP domain-containing protein [Polyangiales bacterium]
MTTRHRIFSSCWLALVLSACASRAGAPPALPSQRFVAPGTPADAYRSEPPEGDALLGPHAVRVGRGVEAAMHQRNVILSPDARLGTLASWAAQALDPQGTPPPFSAIDLWAHHLGLPEPAPHLLVLTRGDPAHVEEATTAELTHMLSEQRYTHYGAATLERNGEVVVVLALAWRWLEMRPVPRVLPVGAEIDLEGRLSPELSAATLVVSYPDGTIHRSDPTPDQAFALRAPSRGRGEHRVELLASSSLGETVVANFPIYVGVAPVTEITTAPNGGPALGPQQTSQRLLELINAERTHRRLHELSNNASLARVAEAHSQDMQAHGFIGHTSKTTGNAEDRVRNAGIRTTLVLENIGRGYSPEEVHRGLMESPGHRENLLHAQATDVGIGVVVTQEDQRNAYLVTELFARFAKPIAVESAAAQLRETVNRERTRRRLRPLATDAGLSELCGQAARDFFQGDARESQRDLVQHLSQRAAASHPPYRRLGTLMTIVTSLDEAAVLAALYDPDARALGLGVAQGSRSDTLDNAIAIVALIGY